MRSFFNELDNCILIINKVGKIEFCNEALLSKLKYGIEEIQYKDIKFILDNYIDIFNEVEKVYTLNSKGAGKIKLLGKTYNKEFEGKEVLFVVFKEMAKEKSIIDKTLDMFPLPVWVKDINGVYKYVNNAFAEIMNNDKNSIIGKKSSDLWGEDSLKYFASNENKIIRDKQMIHRDESIIVNGEEKQYETYMIPIINNKDEVEYITGFSRDITLDKNLESKINDSHMKVATVKSILEEREGSNILLDNIKKELISFLKADAASIWLYDDNKEILYPYLKVGIADELLVNIDEIKISNKDFYEVVDNKIIEEFKEVSEVDYLINKESVTRNYITQIGTYKIKFNNKIIGLLCIAYKNLPENKNIKDSVIKSICNEIAILINNESLYKKLKNEFKNRVNIEEELQCFLDIAADLMAIIDIDSSFNKVNGRWEKILQWTEEELLSRKWNEIVHEEDIDDTISMAKYLRSLDKFEDIKATNRLKCKDGNIKWINWSGKFIKEKNVYIVTGKDITEQKLAESKNKSFEKALELESIKNEFFANISHEFKTPLNIILATIQLINSYISGGKIYVEEGIDLNKYIKSIKQNSYRLLRLANNLIDMTKIDSGYYVINLENNNIVNIIEDITISVAQYVENKGIELIFDTDVEEKIIACDPDKIERVMLNLLSNAVKYTGCDGCIKVNLKTDDEWVTVSVKDTGIGIPKDKIDIIFKRFIQIDSTLTRKNEGSGIGLSLVKSLIEMHSGTIDVKSEYKKGTEFIFKLPIKVVDKNNSDKIVEDNSRSNVEKCNIEFSDIYDIQ